MRSVYRENIWDTARSSELSIMVLCTKAGNSSVSYNSDFILVLIYYSFFLLPSPQFFPSIQTPIQGKWQRPSLPPSSPSSHHSSKLPSSQPAPVHTRPGSGVGHRAQNKTRLGSAFKGRWPLKHVLCHVPYT